MRTESRLRIIDLINHAVGSRVEALHFGGFTAGVALFRAVFGYAGEGHGGS